MLPLPSTISPSARRRSSCRFCGGRRRGRSSSLCRWGDQEELPTLRGALDLAAELRPDLGAAWHSVRTRALVCEPKIIMADEPTGNLDSTQGQEIMAILQRLHDEGTTIVMVTHEDEIAQHAERIVTFHDGVIHSDNQVAQRRLARLA